MSDKSPHPDLRFAGFWKRVLATLIDSVIGMALMPISFWLVGQCFMHRTLAPNLAYIAAFQVVYLFFVIRLGGTPGKLVIGLRIVDRGGNFLGIRRAIMRDLPYWIIWIPSCLMLHAAIVSAPEFSVPPDLKVRAQLMFEHGSRYRLANEIGSYFILVDVLNILFNKYKRAIHDFIAGSYVVHRVSYQKVKELTSVQNLTPSFVARRWD